jgi:hypothetical protein
VTRRREISYMLGVRNYTQEYMDGCRSRVDLDLSAYRKLVAAARKNPASNEARLNTAIEAFEGVFFNNMVLILDHFFVHRLRTIEGKDGNPLNEVRVLCDSFMHNSGVMTADKSIKLSSSRSVLKYQVGDEIKLNEAAFLLISGAFFAEIESKYL